MHVLKGFKALEALIYILLTTTLKKEDRTVEVMSCVRMEVKK